MSDYNGSSMGLAVILGELRADSRHMTAAIERQNGILLDIDNTLTELPEKIAMTISRASVNRSPDLEHTHGILKSIPPILKAAVPLLTILGLMTGRISWQDIPAAFGVQVIQK